MRGKQTPVEDVSLPSQKRNSTSHKALTQSIQWSPDEQMELNEARDWRHRQRLEKKNAQPNCKAAGTSRSCTFR
jgi:hypothetical protein